MNRFPDCSHVLFFVLLSITIMLSDYGAVFSLFLLLLTVLLPLFRLPSLLTAEAFSTPVVADALLQGDLLAPQGPTLLFILLP